MNRKSQFVICSLTAICALSVASISAQPARDEVKVNFSAPVMVPDATLPVGTYVLKLAGATATRNLVQVWNADETQVFVTALTVPARRTDPKGDVVIKFARTPSPKLAPALKAYFYPGDITGHEFVYPEEQAKRISDETKTAVLSHEITSGKFEGWERATISLWDQGKKKPYAERQGKTQ